MKWGNENFIFQSSIYENEFSSVHCCKESKSGKEIALKIINKSKIIKLNMLHHLRREIEIHSHLK